MVVETTMADEEALGMSWRAIDDGGHNWTVLKSTALIVAAENAAENGDFDAVGRLAEDTFGTKWRGFVDLGDGCDPNNPDLNVKALYKFTRPLKKPGLYVGFHGDLVVPPQHLAETKGDFAWEVGSDQLKRRVAAKGLTRPNVQQRNLSTAPKFKVSADPPFPSGLVWYRLTPVPGKPFICILDVKIHQLPHKKKSGDGDDAAAAAAESNNNNLEAAVAASSENNDDQEDESGLEKITVFDQVLYPPIVSLAHENTEHFKKRPRSDEPHRSVPPDPPSSREEWKIKVSELAARIKLGKEEPSDWAYSKVLEDYYQPVRVLLLAFCTPRGDILELEREAEELIEAGVIVRAVSPISLTKLRKVLLGSVERKEPPFEYVQFSGHGVGADKANLTFEHEGDKESHENIQDLGFAKLLSVYQSHTETPLRAVLLNCCKSAENAKTVASVAGVACVGCVGEVSDAAARTFSCSFWDSAASVRDVRRAFGYAQAELMAKPEYSKEAEKFILEEPPKDKQQDSVLPSSKEEAEKFIFEEPGPKDKQRESVLPSSYKQSAERDLMIRLQYEEDAALSEDAHHDPKELRPYQRELLDAARDRNSLVSLPTGAGKTLICFELMVEHRRDPAKKGLKCAFLAQTIPLMFQQARACARQTGLKVGKYCGDDSSFEKNSGEYCVVDDSSRDFRSVDAAFFTAGLFRELLKTRKLSIAEFSLVVIDECHHTRNNHDYNKIMRDYYFTSPPEVRPRVVGLSASPAERKTLEDTVKLVVQVCRNLGESRLAVVKRETESLREACRKPTMATAVVAPNDDLDYLEQIVVQYLGKLREVLVALDWRDVDRVLPVKKCTKVADWVARLDYISRCSSSTQLGASTKIVLAHLHRVVETYSACDESGGKALTTLHTSLKELEQSWPQLAPSCDAVSSLISSLHRSTLYAELAAGRFKALEESISNRFKALRELLLELEPKLDGHEDRILIFVKTRTAASMVSGLLNEFFQQQEIGRESEWVVGHGSSSSTATGQGGGTRGMGAAEQQRRVARFRDGDCSVLVTTSICEEGIDVGPCRVVVRYDAASTATAMLQSRGRARKEGGMLYIFAKSHDDGDKEITRFDAAEKRMLEALVKAPEVLRATEGGDEGETTGRHFLEPDAKAMLEQFAQPRGKPTFSTRREDSSPVKSRFVSTVEMPMGCDVPRLNECAESRLTKEQAEDAAAYALCVELHRKGRLRDLDPGPQYLMKVCSKAPRESPDDNASRTSLERLDAYCHRTRSRPRWGDVLQNDDADVTGVLCELRVDESSPWRAAAPTEREAKEECALMALRDLDIGATTPPPPPSFDAAALQSLDVPKCRSILESSSKNALMRLNELSQRFPELLFDFKELPKNSQDGNFVFQYTLHGEPIVGAVGSAPKIKTAKLKAAEKAIERLLAQQTSAFFLQVLTGKA